MLSPTPTWLRGTIAWGSLVMTMVGSSVSAQGVHQIPAASDPNPESHHPLSRGLNEHVSRNTPSSVSRNTLSSGSHHNAITRADAAPQNATAIRSSGSRPADPAPDSNIGFPTLESSRSVTDADQDESSNSFLAGPLVSTGSSLLIVLGLFGGIVWVSKRYGPGSGTSNIPANEFFEILGSQTIDPRNKLLLVRCGAKIVVVGQSPAGLHTLTEVTDSRDLEGLSSRIREEVDLPISFSGLRS